MAAHDCRPADPPDGTVRAGRQSHDPFRPRSAAGKEANDHTGAPDADAPGISGARRSIPRHQIMTVQIIRQAPGKGQNSR